MRLLIALSFLVLSVSVIFYTIDFENIISEIAEEQLQELGIPDARLTVSEISLERVAFSGVSLGDTLSIPLLKASFEWSELFSGSVNSIKIDDLSLKVVNTGERFSLGALDQLIYQAEGETDVQLEEVSANQTIEWPIKTLDLNNAKIEII